MAPRNSLLTGELFSYTTPYVPRVLTKRLHFGEKVCAATSCDA
jgi:hypothetical protein